MVVVVTVMMAMMCYQCGWGQDDTIDIYTNVCLFLGSPSLFWPIFTHQRHFAVTSPRRESTVGIPILCGLIGIENRFRGGWADDVEKMSTLVYNKCPGWKGETECWKGNRWSERSQIGGADLEEPCQRETWSPPGVFYLLWGILVGFHCLCPTSVGSRQAQSSHLFCLREQFLPSEASSRWASMRDQQGMLCPLPAPCTQGWACQWELHMSVTQTSPTSPGTPCVVICGTTLPRYLDVLWHLEKESVWKRKSPYTCTSPLDGHNKISLRPPWSITILWFISLSTLPD